jgi:DNA-binding transcriptional ArsR family regulator
MVAYWGMSDVFAAVADPTRRYLLGRLREGGPASIARLSEGLPMTRQAVTKHLGVLEAAGLIEKRPEGREMVHALSSEPLKQVSDWLAPYEAAWDERLARLEAHLADKPEPTERVEEEE